MIWEAFFSNSVGGIHLSKVGSSPSQQVLAQVLALLSCTIASTSYSLFTNGLSPASTKKNGLK